MIRKFIPYGHQHITDEDIQVVVETLKSDYLTQGPKIAEFEQSHTRLHNTLVIKRSHRAGVISFSSAGAERHNLKVILFVP